MSKLFAGIDPGLEGALVIINPASREVVMAQTMPLMAGEKEGRKDIDSVLLHLYLARYRSSIDMLALERVHARPGQGVASTFSFGRVFGKTIACLEILGIPFRYVTPAVWVKKILPEGIDDKRASIQWFEERFGAGHLLPGRRKKPHDGIADAGCLAEYAHLDYHSTPT